MRDSSKLLLCVLVLLSVLSVGCSASRATLNVGEAASQRGFISKTLPNGRRYCVFLPGNYTPSRKWPAIVFLHGIGEAGRDLSGPLRVGIAPTLAERKNDFPFIVIIPQSTGGWDPGSDNAADAIAALEMAKREYAIDPDRVSLTGLSTGGYGTFAIGAKYSHEFAALVPMCPSSAFTSGGETLGRMNIWAIENAADPFVAPASMALTLGSIKSNGGTLKHTVYPAVGHNCWDTAYQKGELFEWLLQQRRNGAVASTPKREPSPVKPLAAKPAEPARRPAAPVQVSAPARTSRTMPVAPAPAYRAAPTRSTGKPEVLPATPY